MFRLSCEIKNIKSTHGRHAVNTSRLQIKTVKTKTHKRNTCNVQSSEVRFAHHSFCSTAMGMRGCATAVGKTKFSSPLFRQPSIWPCCTSSGWAGSKSITWSGPVRKFKNSCHRFSQRHMVWPCVEECAGGSSTSGSAATG